MINGKPREKGSALLMSMVFAVAFSVIGIGTVRMIGHGRDMHAQEMEIIKSHWANESMAQIACRYLSLKNAGTGSTTLPDPSGSYSFSSGISAINGYALPSVTFTTTTNSNVVREFAVKCSLDIKETNYANVLTLSGITITTFSKYTFFLNGGLQGWWETMIIDGNVHSNEKVQVWKEALDTMLVSGELTVGEPYYNSYLNAPYDYGLKLRGGSPPSGLYGSNNAERTDWMSRRFPNYKQTQVINVPDQIDPNAITGDVDIASGPGHVRLVVNGTQVNVYRAAVQSDSWSGTYVPGGNWGAPVQTIDITTLANNTITVDDTCWIKGTLDGRLNIVTRTGNDIFLGDDMMFTNTDLDPQSASVSDDALTLISGEDFVVPWVADHVDPQKIRDNGITVMASLVAPTAGSIMRVQGWSHYYDAGFVIDHIAAGDWSDAMHNGVMFHPPFNLYGSFAVDDMYGFYSEMDGWGPEYGNCPNLTDNHRGLMAKFRKDPRQLQNVIQPPGIPLIKGDDDELGALMWLINSGTWTSEIVYKGS